MLPGKLFFAYDNFISFVYSSFECRMEVRICLWCNSCSGDLGLLAMSALHLFVSLLTIAMFLCAAGVVLSDSYVLS